MQVLKIQEKIPTELFYGINVFLTLYTLFSICTHVAVLNLVSTLYDFTTLYFSLAMLCFLMTSSLLVLVSGLFKIRFVVLVLETCFIIVESVSSFLSLQAIFPKMEGTLGTLFFFSNALFWIATSAVAMLLVFGALGGIVALIGMAAQFQYKRLKTPASTPEYEQVPLTSA